MNAQFDLQFSVANVTCPSGSNGQIQVNLVSQTNCGPGPYQYQLIGPSPSNTSITSSLTSNTVYTFTGLTAGTYTVNALYEGEPCATGQSSVGQPNAITINPTITQPLCAQANAVGNNYLGAAVLLINGGTPGSCANACRGYNVYWTGPSSSSGGSLNSCPKQVVTCSQSSVNNNYSMPSLAQGTYNITVVDFNGCQANSNFTINPIQPIVPTLTSSNIPCSGGFGAISVSGLGLNDGTPGQTGFNITWSGPVSGPSGNSTNEITPPSFSSYTIDSLLVGTYSVTINDANNCSFVSSSIQITQPIPLTVNYTSFGAACYNESNGYVVFNVSGGNPAYSISWTGPLNGSVANAILNSGGNDTIFNLSPGTYTFTISDNGGGCTTTQTVTIANPPQLTVSPVVNNVSCFGQNTGSVVLNVQGGNPHNGNTHGYNVSYSGPNNLSVNPNGYEIIPAAGVISGTYSGMVNLSAGNYTSVVTDLFGCTVSNSILITEPQSALLLGSFNTNNACSNTSTGSINLTPIGGTPPYSYLWTNGSTVQDPTGLPNGSYSVAVTDANNCIQTLTDTVSSPPALVLSTEIINVNCFNQANGYIDLIVNGGTAGYSYSWNSGAVIQDLGPLAPGNYSVTVTDVNGCTASTSATITQPQAPLSLSTTQVNILCFGQSNGSINLTPTGGTGAYTYLWNTGATTQDLSNLIAGTYGVTVTDANGCSAQTSVTITQSQTPVLASSTQVNVLCYGNTTGSIDVSVSGGTSPYTYAWSNNAVTQDVANIGSGTYTVVVTDVNGCTDTVVTTITQPQTALTLTSTQVNVGCTGNSTGIIDLSVSGGTAPYGYVWSTGQTTQDASGLSTGSYEVIVTDASGCTDSITRTITQPQAPLSLSTTQVNILCFGQSNGSINLTPTGGTGAYTYLWNTGATTQDLSNLIAGTYGVTVTDANGCSAQTSVTITQSQTPVTASSTQVNVLCYGNTTGSIDVSVSGGTSPYTYAWSNNAVTQDVANIGSGTYTVVVTDVNGCTDTVVTTITQPQTALTLTSTQVNVGCTGNSTGIIDLSVSGGTAPYGYVWSTGQTTQDASGLSTGSYEVIVTDASGCTDSITRTITQPQSSLTATSTQINVLCHGSTTGSIDVSVSGGTAPYSYVWNTGATTQDLQNIGIGLYNVTVTDANGCSAQTSVTITQPQTPVLASSTQVNVLCYGNTTGSIDVSVSGGTSPYTYAWSNNAVTQDVANIGSGTYTVVVTDVNGCTDTVVTTITQPQTALTLTSTQVNVGCTGNSTGIIDLSVSGGTAPYGYVWSTGQTTQDASGLSTGSYEVIVTDASGCTDSITRTITQPQAPLSLSTTQVNILCFGQSNGSINLTPTGGTGAYTYLWNTGATTQDLSNLIAGTYGVTVTDANGCSAQTSVTITQSQTPVTASSTQVNVLCYGNTTGSIDVSVSGGTSPYTYAWSNNAVTQDVANIGSGTYTVVVTDVNGCTDTVVTTITQPQTALTLTSTQVNVGCTGNSTGIIDLSVSGGTAPYGYVWSTGQTTQDASGLSTGSYEVIVTDASGCTDSITRTITQPQSSLTATSTQINVLCHGSTTGSIDVSVSGGTAPYSYVWNTGATTQDLQNIGIGLYNVTVTDANGCSAQTSVTITQPQTPVLASSTQVNVLCYGNTTGSIDVSVSGGTSPYTYAWSNNAVTQDVANIGSGTYTVVVTDVNGCTDTVVTTITQPQTALTLTSTQVNVGCTGNSTGIIDLSVSGGTAPYGYVWSTGQTTQDASGLSTGSYEVIVTDASGCKDSITRTITQPQSSLTATSTQVNVLCHGSTTGSIDVSVSGGTAPYSYVWNTGATTQDLQNIGIGLYSVTVTDANGCSAQTSVTITQPQTPVLASSTQVNVLCYGNTTGSIDVSVSGGTSPYTYAWSNNAVTQDVANIGSGTYTVVVTDVNGCTDTVVTTITQPQTALTLTSTQVNVGCTGNSTGIIDLSVSGGTAPYGYVWSTGQTTQDASGLSTGSYEVIVTDASGCKDSITRTITQPQSSLTATSTQVNVLCHGSTTGSIDVSVSGGTAPYSYVWNTGATTQDLQNIGIGLYSVTVTDANGCSAQTSVTITQPQAITISVNQTNVNCYGASTGQISLNVNGGILPYSYDWSNGTTTQNLSSIPAGTYSVIVEDGNGCKDSTQITISQNPDIFATLQSNALLCNGSQNGILNFTASGGFGPINYSTQPPSNSGIVVSGQNTIDSLLAGNYTLLLTDVYGCSQSFPFVINSPQPISIVSNPTQITCNGFNNGAISITSITGGTAPYSFVWNNGATTQSISSLSSGVYDVVITDINNCTYSQSWTINNQPSGLVTTLDTVVQIICNGQNTGEILIDVTGGTPPYMYNWTTQGGGNYQANTQDISNLSPGDYSVTVTDNNGCVSSLGPYNLSVPSPILYSFSTQNVQCNGGSTGSINLTPSGGIGPYTYTWSNGSSNEDLSNLAAGVYNVIITDINQCFIAASATITQPQNPILLTTTQTNVLCHGGNTGAIDLSVSGGTQPYSYQWSNSTTVQDPNSLVAGLYNVIVTDLNGCNSTISTTINQPVSPLVIDTFDLNSSICFGNNSGSIDISVSGGLTSYVYQWSNGAVTQDIQNLAPGNYSVTVTDANGCTVSQNGTIIQPAPSLQLTASQQNVACYNGTNGSIDLTVIGGSAPYIYSWSNGASSEDLNNLIADQYIVLVTAANGCTAQTSITITQPNATLQAFTTVISNNPCFGNSNGQATVGVVGGTQPYTYLWSNLANQDTASSLTAGTYNVTVTDANGCTATSSATITQPLSTLTLTTSILNVSCHGASTGSIDLGVSGGTGPYSYQWSNNTAQQDLQNLVAGTYTVTVTDANGCSSFTSAVITQPSNPISASYVQTNVSCNGLNNGAIDVTVTGGTSPYSYAWSHGPTTEDLTGLSSGTYSLTITYSQQCTTTLNATIMNPLALSLSISQTNVSCNGGGNGSLDLTVAGGTAPYTYSWNTNSVSQDINNLSVGTYNVTVTDANGCQGTTSATVTSPAALSLNAIPNNVLCYGSSTGSIDLLPTGGAAPYTYLWSNGSAVQDPQNLVAGAYSVVVTDANGCTATTNTTITEPASGIAITSVVTPVTCNGLATGAIDLTVSGGTGSYTYFWSNGALSQDISGVAAGNYNVNVTYSGQCTASATITVPQPSPVVLTTTQVNLICNGVGSGSINLTASGGSGPYTYLWSNGAQTEDVSNLSATNYSVTVTDANGCTATTTATIIQPSAIQIAVGLTNVVCHGNSSGALNITVSGGTGTYTYLWNNNSTTEDISSLPSGTYSVIVTDANGCTASASATISQPQAPLSLSTTQVNILCFGNSTGSIDLTPSGGTAPYSYQWSNSTSLQDPQNLVAGTYTVTATDANGCSSFTSAVITQPANPISASYVQTNVTCNGFSDGAINVSVSGGTVPYTYAWSHGPTTEDLTGLLAGTYNATITDLNQCQTTLNVSIIHPQPITLSTTQTNVSCNSGGNGAINLSVAGGTSPYTYVWSTGALTQDINNLAAGSYNVTVTDANNCTATISATITQPQAPLSLSSTQVNVLCHGANTGSINLTPTGGTTPYTYLWSNNATVQDPQNLVAGAYSVLVTDANGCTATTNATITQPQNPLTLTTTKVNVLCFGNSTGSIDLTVSGGTGIYTYSWNTGAITQDITGLLAGIYTVTVTDANACTATTTVTITQPQAPLALTTSQVNVLCFGNSTGSINLTPTGGTPLYTYVWSTGALTQDINNLAAGSYNVTVTDANNCTATISATITQPQAPLSLSSTQVNVLCHGANTGSINLTPTGGTTPYTYLWSNNATVQDPQNLVAGAYSVLVTDANGCTATTNATITQPQNPLTLTTTKVNVLCFGNSTGSIDLTVSGGTGIYTYSWNTGAITQDITGLLAGIYTVTVTDANACTATTTVTITQPQAPLALTTSQVNVLCFGNSTGSINLTPTGGTPLYTYVWSTGALTQDINNLAAGSYNVTVTDANNCTATISATITQPQAPLSLSSTQVNVLCHGANTGSINLTPTGGTTPYTYLWSNNATVQDPQNLVAGAYSVLVTDANGCTATTNATITQPQNPLTLTTTKVNVLCFGNSTGSIDLTVSGGTGIYTYSWNTGAITQDITGLLAGIYTVTVTDANACTATTTVTITQPQAPLALTTSQVNVLCFGNSTGSINLTPTGGTPLYTYVWSTGALTQDINNLAAGSYNVTVTDANNCTATISATITQPQAPLSLSSTQVNVLCHGANTGSINLTPTGGTTPYTYLWSNNATVQDPQNLVAGAYSVLVTDANGCTATTSATITQPSVNTTLATTHVNVLCFGDATGSIDLTVSGVLPPYTFNWSNSVTTEDISGLIAGLYTVNVVDANGCLASTSVSINQPTSPLSLSTSQNNVCFGGNNGDINLSVSGGSGPFTYVWSNGQTTQDINGLAPGSYSVVVTDANGCVSSISATITAPNAPLSLAETHVDILCHGANTGSIDLSVVGGTQPYTYVWSNGYTQEDPINIFAGTYNVTVIDANGCNINLNITLTQPVAPFTLTAQATDVLCFGANTGSIDLIPSGGTSPYAYIWSNSQTTEDITTLIASTYSVSATDNNGCTAFFTVQVSQPNQPIAIANTISNVLCFGDSTGAINLTISGGTPGYTFNWNGGTYATEDISVLPSGTFIVTVTDANNCQLNDTFFVAQPISPLVSTVTSIDASCFGSSTGSIDLTVNGGTAPYGYTWSTGILTQDLSSIPIGWYYVTVTDAHGCSIQDSALILQPPSSISLSVLTTHILCNGYNTGYVDLTATGGVLPYQYNWNNGAYTTEDLNAVPAGNYSLSLTDANGCVGNISTLIIQPDAIVATPTIVNVLCHGATTGSIDVGVVGGTPYLVGAPYTYLWSTGATTEDLINIGAGTYVLTVTDSNNCSQSFTFIVSEPAALSVAMNAANVDCHGNGNGSISPVVSGGVGPYTYLWTATNGGILTTGPTSSTQINLVPGTYTLLITDANGCTLIDSAIITQPQPLIMSEVHSNINCFGDTTGLIDVTVNGGTAPYTYSWITTINGLPGPTYTSQDLTLVPAGTYDLTITDANNCTVSQVIILTQPGSPISTILTVQDILCHGNSTGSLSVSITGGTQFTPAPHYIIEYFSGGNLIASGVNSVNGLPAGVYQVKVTDTLGCYQIIQDTIFEPVAPLDYSLIPTNVLCYGTNTGSIFVNITGGTTPYSYSWNNGQYVTEDIINLPIGTYQLEVTDANGCILNTFSSTLTSPDSIQLNPYVDNVTCYGFANGQIITNASGGTAPYTYQWSTINGTLQAGQVNLPSIGSTTQPNGLSAAIYTLLLTDGNGCIRIFDVPVNQPAAPLNVVVDSLVSVACKGACSGQIFFTPTGGTPFYWVKLYDTSTGLFVDSLPISTFDLLNPNAVYSFNNLCPGNYYLFIEDSNSCSMNTVIPVQITEPATVMNSVMFVASNAGCTNASGQIQVSASGGNAPYNVSWQHLGTGTLTNPALFEIISDPGTYMATGLSAGLYNVYVTDGNGCSHVEQLLVDSTTSLLAGFIAIDTIGCAPFGVQFSNLSYGVNVSYLWDFGNGQTSTEFEPLAYFAAGGPYDISLTITDAQGCSQTYSNDNYIQSYTGPTASFYAQTDNIDFYSGALQFVNASSDANSFVWDFGDGSPVSYAENPAHLYESMTAGNYIVTLQAIDSNGCMDDTSMVFGSIEPLQMFVPNTISVDGNGLNDEFKPILTLPDLVTKYNLQIYNRWGQLIYETNNQYDSWNGTFRGDKVQLGTYTWKIQFNDYKGNPVNAHGHLNVIR